MTHTHTHLFVYIIHKHTDTVSSFQEVSVFARASKTTKNVYTFLTLSCTGVELFGAFVDI